MEEVKIFPNPASSIIQIILNDPTSKFEAKLIDALGNVVLNSNQKTISVRNIPDGVYIIYIQTEKGYKSQKIIINK
jgi:hypothetical protein